ncbi:growth/differentiation factor [Homoserinimonas sp. OAct 916]|uniref:growth/differentiation factor n=1 Tax=Homoserinimonas sp. OAct 916 TaxID=2211450 RepID=UPI0013005E7A|nr:growth/differentiation factor [Homoserinimonas sp. OAct 916]
MMLTLSAWVIENGQVMAASSSDGEGGNLGLLFLLSGPIFYVVIYLKYRNVDKRHKHESETEASLHNMQLHDQFVQSKTGLTKREMAGANNNDVRGARRKFF